MNYKICIQTSVADRFLPGTRECDVEAISGLFDRTLALENVMRKAISGRTNGLEENMG